MSANVILPVQITRQIEADVAIAVEEIVEFAPVLELFEHGFVSHAASKRNAEQDMSRGAILSIVLLRD